LKELGFKVEALQGEQGQRKREAVLRGFREGAFNILVATDNLLPKDTDSYIHRIGRTGRAGRSGRAYSIMSFGEAKYLHSILKRVKDRIEICKD